MADPAIVAEGLGKRFGHLTAIDGVDLELPAGGVLGMLGPNGAGKTTTVRILATLLPVADGAGILPEVATRLAAAGLHVASLALRRPTLEEAFLAYTGQPASGPLAEPAQTAPDRPSAR